jgi:hypothetical protein
MKAAWLYWKLAITKCGVKCVVAAVGGFLSSVKGLDWAALSGFDRFCLIAGAALTIGTVIDAFLDNTMSQMRGEKPPVGGAEFLPGGPAK